jgi:hypothetical protein
VFVCGTVWIGFGKERVFVSVVLYGVALRWLVCVLSVGQFGVCLGECICVCEGQF